MLSDSALFVHPISENKKQRDFIFTPVQPTQTSSHLDSIFPSPFPGRGLIPDTVGLVNMGDLRDERIVGVGVGQHRANRQKNCGGTSVMYPGHGVHLMVDIGHRPLEMVRAGDH